MKIEEVNFDKVQALIPKLFEVNEESYENKLMEHASIYTTFSILSSEAIKLMGRAEINLDKIIATKTKEAKISSSKKLTVVDVNSIINADDEVVEAKTLLGDLTHKVNLLKGILKGLEHQKDCLVQISANKRKEKDLYIT